MSLEKRVVIISGATGVTGKLAAQKFAALGASLVLLGTDQTRLDALTRELHLPEERILTFAADLTEREAVLALAVTVQAKFKRADILLHLVGGWTGGKTLVETPLEEMQNMLNQHLWTTFHMTQAFLPQLTENGWGRIIVISSPLAVQPTAKMGAYAVGKAAEETLLLTLAQETKESGVTANILQVRSIDTKNPSTSSGQVSKGTKPEEIVEKILYLCTDDASAAINGQRIALFA